MRIVGIILVVLGAMALGWQGFGFVTTEWTGDDSGQASHEMGNSIGIPPLVSGIAMVSGLILLASSSRREEA